MRGGIRFPRSLVFQQRRGKTTAKITYNTCAQSQLNIFSKFTLKRIGNTGIHTALCSFTSSVSIRFLNRLEVNTRQTCCPGATYLLHRDQKINAKGARSAHHTHSGRTLKQRSVDLEGNVARMYVYKPVHSV